MIKKFFKNRHGSKYKSADLIEAAKNNNIESVSKSIRSGIDVNVKDESGITALLYATKNGHMNIMKNMIEAGADVNMRCEPESKQSSDPLNPLTSLIEVCVGFENEEKLAGKTALEIAVLNGHGEAARALLESGADVETKNKIGWTPLMLAAHKGYTKIVQILLKAGAEVNAINNRGATALIYAADEGHTQVVQALVEAGADMNARDETYGWTALEIAVQKGYDEIHEILFKRGTKANEKKLSKEAQADDQKNSDGEELAIAAVEGDADLVRNLIKKGADVNYKGRGGRTALMAAATFGHKDVAHILIENGADVNAKDDENGITILMFAANKRHDDIVKLLIENGADLNAKDKRGKTVSDLLPDS